MRNACLALCLLQTLSFSTLAIADDASEFEVYESAGAYYVKSTPDWVPIAGNITFFIPTYDEGDIVKLTNSGNWTSSYVSYSDFVSANAQPSNATINYTDLNSDGVTDIAVTINGEALYLLADGNETWSLNTAPAISGLANISVSEDTAATRTFVVSDSQESPSELSVSVTSSNTTLIANNQINVTRSGSNYTLTATPTANKSGSSTLTITADDGLQTTTQTMVVTVSAVNDTPTITNIANQTINEDGTVTVGFTVSDVETSAGSLSLTKQSSNTGLLPTGNIVFGGSGSSRTVKLTPLANKNGTATVTIGVSDGNKSASDSFVLTVNSVNDAPTISNVSPNHLDEFDATINIIVSASADDIDGNIDGVEFRLDSGKWHLDTSSPYSFDFGNLAAGIHTLSVRAKDASGDYSSIVNRDILITNNEWAEKGGVVPDQSFAEDFGETIIPNSNNFGATPGAADVSGGAATYSVPIELPSGRAGMQPRISLDYSSRSGNGIGGVGFHVTAGGAITRCSPTLEQDNMVSNIQYDLAIDKLCLNGQRLVPVSGVYGHELTQYRTEIDDMTRVFQYGGEINDPLSYFEVHLPNNLIQYFGLDTVVIAAERTEPISWQLDKTKDYSGNFIRYSYDDYGYGEVLLSSIKYTGNENGEATEEGNREVIFDYELRDDTSTSFLAGGSTRSSRRLATVATYYNQVKIKEYSLDYLSSQASGRSLLKSITECAFDGGGSKCRSATNFEWAENSPTFQLELLETAQGNELIPTDGTKISDINHVPAAGDINGDGVRDWGTYFVDAEGNEIGSNNFQTNSCNKNIFTKKPVCLNGDFNMDGRTDVWTLDNNELLIGYTNFPSTSVTWVNTGITFTSTLAKQDNIVSISDFNGDGWPDIVVEYKSIHTDGDIADHYLSLFVHTQNTQDPYNTEQVIIDLGETGAVSYSFNFVGDMDGNGLPDIAVSYLSTLLPEPTLQTLLLTRNNGSTVSFESHNIKFGGDLTIGAFSILFDVNGDGLLDWLGWIDFSLTNKQLYARLNKGNGQFAAPIGLGDESILALRTTTKMVGPPHDRTELVERYSAKYKDAFKIADINGDGKSDLLVPGNRLATGCFEFTVYQSGGYKNVTKCGDELYGNYIDKNESVSIPSSRDSSVYQYKALSFKEQSDATYTSQLRDSPIIGTANYAFVQDGFGKGLPDLVFAYGCEFTNDCSITVAAGSPLEGLPQNKVYVSRNYGATAAENPNTSDYAAIDLLLEVQDGAGNSSQWDYHPLSTGQIEDFYTTTGETLDDSHFYFASSMYVVSGFRQSNGVGSFNQYSFNYTNATYNVKGRGFRGFSQITRIDEQRGTKTETQFELFFPFTGRVVQQDTYRNSDTFPFRSVSNDWRLNPNYNSSDSYHLYNYQSIDKKYDFSSGNEGILISTITSTVESIDPYGNNLTTKVKVSDDYGEQTQTISAVFDASSTWPHKLKTKTVNSAYVVTNTLNATPDINKVSTTHIIAYTDDRKPNKVTVADSASAIESESACTGASRSSQCLYTVSTYNDYGLPLTVTQKGRITTGSSASSGSVQSRKVTTTYSDTGTGAAEAGYFPYQVTSENGSYDHTVTTQYDPKHGKIITLIDPNGVTSTTQYDNFFRPVVVSKSGMASQEIRYLTPDASSGSAHAVMMVATYEEGAPNTKKYIDKRGRTLRTAVQDFNGAGWIYTDSRYDSLGRIEQQSAPHSGTAIYTSYENYDVLNRPGKKVSPATQTGEYLTANYTYSGLRTTITTSATDGASLTMYRDYDTRGKLMYTQDDKGGETYYAYDALGNPVVIQDAKGHQIVANYDSLGRKLWVNDPNQGTTNFSYNDFGEVETEVHAGGYIYYDYDQLGRVTSRYSSDGTANFTWDTLKKGALTSETASGVTKTYGYDSLARQISATTVIDGVSYAINTQYNQNYGYPKSIEYPNGLVMALEYNARGYLTSEKNAQSGFIYREITAQDAMGNISAAKIAGGEQLGTYVYSLRTGQMLSTLVKHDVDELQNIVYSDYDSYGNIKTQLNSLFGYTTTESYTYDSLHRLMKSTVALSDGPSTSIDYAYDSVGNITKKSDYSINSANAYTYNSGTNQVSGVALLGGGNESFGYDGRGNLILRNGSQEISYNVISKPTYINRLGSQVSLFYDANWARYKQERVVEGETITTYYIDKLYEVEISNSGTKNTSYLSDVAILIENGGGQKIRYAHRDRLGSATTLTDHNSNIIATRYYDPFGKPRNGDGSLMSGNGARARLSNNLYDQDLSTRRGFTDHEHLDEVELIHMNGRVYDYNLGRFLSVDPFIQAPQNSQSVNPYSYIMNNPLAGTDPTGYTSCTGTRIHGMGCGSGVKVIGNPGVYDNRKEVMNNVENAISQMHNKGTSNGKNNNTVAPSKQAMDIGDQQEIAQNSSTNVAAGTAIALPAASGVGELGASLSSATKFLGQFVTRTLSVAIGALIPVNEVGPHVGELTPEMLAQGYIEGMIARATERGENSLTIFRTAGPAESTDIRSTGVFRLGPNEFPKQFTLTLQDAVDFQKALPTMGSQRSNNDFGLPHTVFSAQISFATARAMTPGIITDHKRQSPILTAFDRKTLGRVNTNVLANGGIRELNTR